METARAPPSASASAQNVGPQKPNRGILSSSNQCSSNQTAPANEPHGVVCYTSRFHETDAPISPVVRPSPHFPTNISGAQPAAADDPPASRNKAPRVFFANATLSVGPRLRRKTRLDTRRPAVPIKGGSSTWMSEWVRVETARKKKCGGRNVTAGGQKRVQGGQETAIASRRNA